MKPTIPLINALRRAADRIERKPDSYNWSVAWTCNCGWLACELLGVEPAGLQDMHNWWLSWTTMTKEFVRCDVTGLPIPKMFNALLQHGLEMPDFTIIEHAAKTAPEAAAYFRAQADILEEQLAEQFETRELKPLSPVCPPERVNATDGPVSCEYLAGSAVAGGQA